MKKENKVEHLQKQIEELKSKVESVSEDLSVLISEILKKDDKPVVDVTAMERLAELHKVETETDNWKKAAYMLANDLKAVVEMLTANELEEQIPAINSAKESLQKFRSMRLGIDKPTEEM